MGYYCDTEGGNSGSPVLSRVTHKVIALHHCAYCPNRGVRIALIWAQNQAGAHPLPQCSINSYAGTVDLDRDMYACSDTVNITAFDDHLQGNPSQDVTIWSDSQPSPMTVTLTAKPAGSGNFTGAVDTVSAKAGSRDTLTVAHGDTITVEYIDADDGNGNFNVVVQDAAGVDCVSPVISNVNIGDISPEGATVTWTTYELSDSMVYHNPPSGWNSVYDDTLTTAHSVRLAGLSQCTAYSVWVESADAAGNPDTDDNGGNYYTFTTFEYYVAFSDDIEGVYPNGWSSAAVQGTDDWAYSEARSHSPTHSWFSSGVASLKDDRLMTPSVALNSGAVLTFWQWYNMESGYDGCVIEISTDGGTSFTDLETHITQNGYNRTISTSYSSPIAGQQAWSGSIVDWQEVSVDLSSFAGQEAIIRFRLACDTSVSREGWYIDDVVIQRTQPCEPILGDVNGDAVVDTTDVLLLADYLAGNPVSINTNAADLNDDGAIDAVDLDLLLLDVATG